MDPVGPLIGAAANAIAGSVVKSPSGRITVTSDRDSFGFGGRPHSVFVPATSVDELAPLADLTRNHYSKPYQWVESQHGCDIWRTTFQFVVHAHNASVDIVGAVPLVEAANVRPGLALVKPPAGGPMEIRHLAINLDEATSEHRNLGDSVSVRELGKPDQPVSLLAETLKPGESTLFHVEAYATTGTYKWALNLRMLVDGRERTETLLHNERPFVTMHEGDPAITGRYLFVDGQWVPQV